MTLTVNPMLTRRELEVLKAYARHGTIQGVADELELARSTVKNHLSTAYTTLGVRGAIGAFKVMGWLDPDDH